MARGRLAIVGISAALMLGLTGCAVAEPIAIDSETVVIDVRTPAEFASGHLDGAINIDLQSDSFTEAIDQLDDDGEYVVYCKSGNRSGQATALMEAEGLVVHDAGSMGSAEQATGLPVVR